MDISELIIVGDRVLIAPQEGEQQTNAGLYLPATVTEKEKVGTGRVIRVGPGHLMANPDYNEGEPWAHPEEAVRYLPLQAQVGDFAFYLRKEAIEITYQHKTYLIVPHNAILALIRPKEEDILKDIGELLDDK
jgi:co-chaperonin GroES (HSP10)